MRNEPNQWYIPAFLAVAAGLALWFYWLQTSQPELQPVPVPEVVEPEERPGPLHPVATDSDAGGERPTLVPLPPLDQSDEYFKLAITDIFGKSVEDLLAQTGMIERIVATIDNLPREHVAERLRPLNPLPDPFLVDGQDGSGEFAINPDNYRRYDVLVGLFTNANLKDIGELYRRFYPLFQRAYVGLGYPDGYFNDRLVEVIDHLLATPVISDPVELVRPHVLYEYRDARLEALSSGQKLMLRMGPEHAARVRARLRELREVVTKM